MARANRRRNKGNSRGSHHASAHVPLHNTFASLTEKSDETITGDQLNTHLSERLGGHVSYENSAVPRDDVPYSVPSQDNNDIAQYFKKLADKPINGSAWLEKPEVPHTSEVFCKRLMPSTGQEKLVDVDDEIRPHKVEGAYESKEDYLRTKYELLREDALLPLREAIQEVRNAPFKDEIEYNGQSIGIYDPVYITGLVCSPRGLATRVAFSLSRVKKRIRWKQSKRLITGTLVALSPTSDAFRTQCILATVAARPLSALEQNPPEIDLFFARPEDQEIDPMKKWIMVECRSTFFEASRHTLQSLKSLTKEPFPMAKYLVDVQKQVAPPAYVEHTPYMNMGSLVSIEEAEKHENVNILREWPSLSSHTLDKSQSAALQRMLTKEFAIVKGPPGTGKTFVSAKAIQIICDNLRKDDAPVIITAQTNHALDQILRHTAQFEPNYIRLGGRSKDKNIKERTLFNIRAGVPPTKSPWSRKQQAAADMRKLTSQLQMILAPLQVNKPPLDPKLLQQFKLISKDQADSLELESQCTMGISPADSPGVLMEQWLGRYLAPCNRPIIPDDYGWSFEEEDLEEEQLKELEAEAVAQDDDDIEALRGPAILLSDNHSGKGGPPLSTADIDDLLQRTEDLNTIHPPNRASLYNHFMRKTKKKMVAEVRNMAKAYAKAVQERKIGLWEEDVRILRDARIIGCTTTGLSKYRALLSALRPRTCLVEEAAETLEAPVTAACFPSLEHLILVGDHQQLRPHTQVHAFEDEPFYLNLSLFERLVWNDVEYDTLTGQRRMIPEIRRLLTPIYDNDLKDHASVKDEENRPPVEGMGGVNSFFFHHEWPEQRDANMSAFNGREADMIVGFVDYLVLNGVDPKKITILTFYNGQRKVLMKKLRAHANLTLIAFALQLVTVDSYQGEENDIVLLSLVRSNRRHAIGFLSSENRVCVALSRAKRGFYVFGNAELLASTSTTWEQVVKIMWANKTKTKVVHGQERRIGFNLPLQCTNHGNKVWIECPEDWELIHGGCDKACQGFLPCGHRCVYRCHPFAHEQVNCTQRCSKRLEACGHPCVATCCDPCKCPVCEGRTRGIKSIVKPARHGTASLQPLGPGKRSPPPVSTYSNHGAGQIGGGQRQHAHEYQVAPHGYQVHNLTPAASSASVSSVSGLLIETSPRKRSYVTSKNAGLLIDLDLGSPTTPPAEQKPPRSTGKAEINLLD